MVINKQSRVKSSTIIKAVKKINIKCPGMIIRIEQGIANGDVAVKVHERLKQRFIEEIETELGDKVLRVTEGVKVCVCSRLSIEKVRDVIYNTAYKVGLSVTKGVVVNSSKNGINYFGVSVDAERRVYEHVNEFMMELSKKGDIIEFTHYA